MDGVGPEAFGEPSGADETKPVDRKAYFAAFCINFTQINGE
jgi:hypothetical protein